MLQKLSFVVCCLMLMLTVNLALAQEDRGHLRIAHLSPDAPNVDVFVDGSAVLADVAYLTVSAPMMIEPGALVRT